MTRPPDFDDLVGSEVERAERERLRAVHELLVEAGPPPELSPEIELGPTLGTTLARRGGRGGRSQRGVLLLAAALAALGLAFLGGYLAAGNGKGSGKATGIVLKLTGTRAAPTALASLRLEPADTSGNWPMKITATGLPKLPPHGYYTVWIMRHGKPWAPCGTFIVADAQHTVSVWLNAPYRLRHGDKWIVTEQLPGHHEAGRTVLEPASSA
jgi:hypothetical protein